MGATVLHAYSSPTLRCVEATTTLLRGKPIAVYVNHCMLRVLQRNNIKLFYPNLAPIAHLCQPIFVLDIKRIREHLNHT
jgi:hypothetical protein